MKILVLNGSPRGGQSDTLRLTRAFLEGMGEAENAEIVAVAAADVRPCRGCFSCWRQTPGRCVIDDDMAEILAKAREAELVIWSTPLYCYSVPSGLKAVMDRLLPLSCMTMTTGAAGQTHHAAVGRVCRQHLLISGCGFPDYEGNFDGLVFQFERMFGAGLPRILCAEAPLLSLAEAAPVALPYLETVKKAGAEYKATGRIAAETQAALDAPMLDPEVYRKGVNGEA